MGQFDNRPFLFHSDADGMGRGLNSGQFSGVVDSQQQGQAVGNLRCIDRIDQIADGYSVISRQT